MIHFHKDLLLSVHPVFNKLTLASIFGTAPNESFFEHMPLNQRLRVCATVKGVTFSSLAISCLRHSKVAFALVAWFPHFLRF